MVVGDARVARLLAPVLPDIPGALAATDVAVWHDSHLRLVGGVVSAELAAPARIGGEWLGMAWVGRDAGSSDAPYRSARYRATLENVTGVRIFVDLERRVVAGIDPDGRQLTVIEEPEYLDPLPDVTRTPH